MNARSQPAQTAFVATIKRGFGTFPEAGIRRGAERREAGGARKEGGLP